MSAWRSLRKLRMEDRGSPSSMLYLRYSIVLIGLLQPARTLQPHAIQPVGIFTADLALHVRAHPGAHPLHRLVGIGPCCVAVRIVTRPHEIVCAENRSCQHPRAIVLESEPSVALHVVPGGHLQLDIGTIGGSPSITVIGLFVHNRNPTHIVFRANDFEVRMAIKDSRKHEMTDETRCRRDPLRAEEIT